MQQPMLPTSFRRDSSPENNPDEKSVKILPRDRSVTLPENFNRSDDGRKRSTVFGEIDLDLYKQLEVHHEFVNKKVDSNSLGEIQCVTQYIKDENSILIELRRLQINWKPKVLIHGVPRPNDFNVYLEFKFQCKTKKNIRRISTIDSNSNLIKLELYQPIEVPIKNKEQTYLRLVLFDALKVIEQLAIGYVYVPLKEILKSTETVEINQSFFPCKQLRLNELRKSSTIAGSLLWEKSYNFLHVNLSSFSDIEPNKKEYFLRATLYIGNINYSTQKLAEVRTGNFCRKVSFILPKSNDSIQNSTILLELFEKNLFNNKSLGQIVLGPYMKVPVENKLLSCWEAMIVNPNDPAEFKEEIYSL